MPGVAVHVCGIAGLVVGVPHIGYLDWITDLTTELTLNVTERWHAGS